MNKNALIAALALASSAVSVHAAVPNVGTRFTDSKTGIELKSSTFQLSSTA